MLEIRLAFFVFHVSVYDKVLDPMITLNKRFKTPARKIFPRFIVCRRLRSKGRCRKLLRLCWLLQKHLQHENRKETEGICTQALKRSVHSGTWKGSIYLVVLSSFLDFE